MVVGKRGRACFHGTFGHCSLCLWSLGCLIFFLLCSDFQRCRETIGTNCDIRHSFFENSFFPHLPGEGLSEFLPPPLASYSLQTPDLSARCRIATAGPQLRAPPTSAPDRSEWALCLDFNGERQISVGTAGPQPRASDLSWKCCAPRGHQISVRTSRPTAGSGSQQALPHGPQPRASDLIGKRRI